MTRVRRSVLFMPGDSLKKITKAATQLAVDCVVMDLEDGVALDRKEEARQTVLEAGKTLDFGSREKWIRINPTSTSWWQDDLAETIEARPNAYVIPKVESAQDLQQICDWLTQAEKERGWEPSSIELVGIIETAKGVLCLPQIVAATDRLSAMMFGSEDLAGDMGAIRTPEGWEVFYARSAVVTAAAAYRIDAIDTIFADFNDPEGLQKEATVARQMGYSGKIAIHPRQVPILNDAFSPTEAEIEHATKLIAAHDANQAAGTGAFAYEGKMVDMPMIRSAQKILAQAQATGQRNQDSSSE